MSPVTDNTVFSPAQQDVQSCPVPTANPQDVERVKGKWGEDLNTAFPYEKYTDRGVGATWAASALRYEAQDDMDGDTLAPRDEALEKQLFGDEGEGNMGINFDKYIPLQIRIQSFLVLVMNDFWW